MNQPPFSSPLEETVVIVGVGMIGGSLAAAIKSRRLARHIIGVGRDRSRIEAARDAGLIDEAATDIATVIGRANLVVFCTPVERVVADVQDAYDKLRETFRQSAGGGTNSDLLLTDVGSVKSPICTSLTKIPEFVGSHPIAGSHRQGFEAAESKLFEGRLCVLTPSASAEESRVARLERFWQGVGMRTVRMSSEAHDASLAMTSHLPHVVAAALAATLTEENRLFTGSGFRDTTRVAGGDSDLWTGILINNSEHLLHGIDLIHSGLARFRAALEQKDADEIRRLLTDGKRSRASLDETPH